ncbi:hypothetical protein CC1G_05899 [Coprinopsis cinerea okayama7|uniref:Uncharacterized protein n=1 Tax=Coprinopsis cinerea (strain Okayama-7 / 130 / ATCC MYA-4618 / FGSC 9003) TaxID=240176 RepID=A8NAE8_COPC7|nr:hypothetical protein CC1G_05899 [Coprinopsis cinerea okayama7\|eukprot:XP_001831800.2 hypothetical protein CC1G_05899 [Coprinopsis cinerea okayama7\
MSHPSLNSPPSPQRIENEVWYSSTNELFSSLRSLGFGFPSTPYSSSVRPVNPNKQGPILRLLDAFANIADVNQSRVALSCSRTTLTHDGVLSLELTVCGTCPPGPTVTTRGTTNAIKPLELILRRGPTVTLLDHIQALKFFLERLRTEPSTRPAFKSLARYITASFAESTFIRLENSIEDRQFLQSLRDEPLPSTIQGDFHLHQCQPWEIDADIRFLQHLRHKSALDTLNPPNLVHLPRIANQPYSPSRPIYTAETCDEFHHLLLFLLNGYIAKLENFVQSAREGRVAINTHQWDRNKSKKFSTLCTTLTAYGIVLRDLAGSPAFVQHLKRVSRFLTLPDVDPHHAPYTRSGSALYNALLSGNVVGAYIAWTKSLLGPLQSLLVIQKAFAKYKRQAEEERLPLPKISFNTVITIPAEYRTHQAERAKRREWRSVATEALKASPPESTPSEGPGARFSPAAYIQLLEFAGLPKSGDLLTDPDPTRSASCTHPEELGNAGHFHPELCLATLLSYYAQNDENPNTDNPIPFKEIIPVGTSGSNCAGCNAVFAAIREKYHRLVLPGWLLEPGTPPSANGCHLPEWLTDEFVETAVPQVRRQLQILVDSQVNQVHASDLESDSDMDDSESEEGEYGPEDDADDSMDQDGHSDHDEDEVMV